MKKKTKKKIVKIADRLSYNCTRRLRIVRSLINLILISFFIVIFFLGFQGIQKDLITSYFEIFITFAILLLLTILGVFLLRSDFRNGFLGAGNTAVFILGIFAGLTGDTTFLTSADIIINSLWILTFASLVYIWAKKNKKDIIKLTKKYKKC